MDDPVRETVIECPWCWESFAILVDLTGGSQEWVEDCTVCCHPIEFGLKILSDGAPDLIVARSD